MKKAIFCSVISIGFIAMASQIIYLREFLIVFYGNELSIGFILANWLVGGAIGSSLLGHTADRARFKITIYSLCQTSLGFILPLTILAIRSVKNIIGIEPGAIMPPFPMAISSFLILAPTCIILGYMFSLASRIYRDESPNAAVGIGKVYMLEAAGAIAGGIVTSYILIRLLDPVIIMTAFSLLNILMSFLLLYLSKETKLNKLFMTVNLIIIITMISMWPLKGWNSVTKDSLKSQWRGYKLLESKDSVYGNIAVTEKENQFSFFDNGLHLYTIPDEQNAEEAVHFALLEHPDPKEVLLIGGGVGGLLAEILKHPVAKVDYVELDPLIIKMAKEYLPGEYYRPLEDVRVSIINTDGRYYIKTADAKYDSVIIHLGDPYTAQLNRYYTVEFLEEVKRVLNKGGIVSFALTSSESYMNKELREFLQSIYATLKNVFRDVKVIPGNTAYFLASDEKGLLTYDYNILVDRSRQRSLDIKYVREYYLFSRLSPEKIAYVEDAIEKEGRINYDFRPISYYYGMIFWTTYFRDSLSTKILKATTEKIIWNIIYFICAIIILSGFIISRYKRSYKKAILLAVMATGFSTIAFQIIVLLAFQIIYGYLFYKMGMVLTSFMIGLALGGWLSISTLEKIKKEKPVFNCAQLAISLYSFILPLLFLWLANSKGPVVWRMGSNVFFMCIPIIAGFIGGFQFPLANKIYLGEERGVVGRVAGLTYGIDLFGSCLGAFATGAFLIPVLGIPKTCVAIAVLNLAVLIPLILPQLKHD